MTSPSLPLWISAVWVSFTLLMCLAPDVSSVRGWVLVTIGVVLPFILLWSTSYSPAVAETQTIHASEDYR